MNLLNLILKPFAIVAFWIVVSLYFAALILFGLMFAIVNPKDTWQILKEINLLKEP